MWLLHAKGHLHIRDCADSFVCTQFSPHNHLGGRATLLDFKMWQLRLRVAESLAQGHTAGQCGIRIHTGAACCLHWFRPIQTWCLSGPTACGALWEGKDSAHYTPKPGTQLPLEFLVE